MKPNEIMAALMLAGVRPTAIAKKLNVSKSAISGVIYGTFKSQRIAEAIAEAINKDVSEVWPQWAA